jgi:mannose/fructose/N-acetylgalactosamine-specific phosphotransferase system component IID
LIREAKKSEKRSVTGVTLAGAALRGLFLESSWNDDGQQNLGRATVLLPIAKKLLKSGARGGPPKEPKGSLDPLALESAERALTLNLLQPFNTNPVTAGLVLGATIRAEEERAEGTGRPAEEPLGDSFLSSLASVSSAQGDQIFWNTWLPFCSLLAFFVAHFTSSYLAPFLLPLLFCLLAFPVRFGAFFLGYLRGREVCSHKLLGLILILRRRLHASLFFLTGFFTVLLLYRLSRAGPGPGPEPGAGWGAALGAGLGAYVWLYAALIFLILYVSGGLRKRWRFLSAPLYVFDVFLFYLIFLIL